MVAHTSGSRRSNARTAPNWAQRHRWTVVGASALVMMGVGAEILRLLVETRIAANTPAAPASVPARPVESTVPSIVTGAVSTQTPYMAPDQQVETNPPAGAAPVVGAQDEPKSAAAVALSAVAEAPVGGGSAPAQASSTTVAPDYSNANKPTWCASSNLNKVESVICKTAAAWEMDAKLTAAYKAALERGGSEVKGEQRAFLKLRDSVCGRVADVAACVADKTASRIQELQAVNAGASNASSIASASADPSVAAPPANVSQPGWCPQAQTAVEKAICASPVLQALDQQMNEAYKAKGGNGNRALRNEQKSWNGRRSSDPTVLERQYRERLEKGFGVKPTSAVWPEARAHNLAVFSRFARFTFS